MSINADMERAVTRAEAVHQLGKQTFASAHQLPSLRFDQLLALNFVARGLTTHRAVKLLVENGLNGEAAATMRTLVELDIDLAFILKDETELRFQRFFEYEHVAMFRLIEENPGSLPPDREQKIRELYEAVRHNYVRNGGWAGITIKQRAVAASRLRQYVTAYALGSSASHSGIGSLKYALGGSEDAIELHIERREPHPALLEFATLALYRLARSVVGYMQLELAQELDRVENLLDVTMPVGA